MAEITTVTLDSTVNGALPSRGTVYTFNDVNGLTFGELLLAVCLERATTLEAIAVLTLDRLESRTITLAAYAEAAQMVLDGANPEDLVTLPEGYICNICKGTPDLKAFLEIELGLSVPDAPWTYTQRMDLYAALQNLMEPLNQQSEDELIDLQTLVNTRDIFFNLATNSLKKIQTTTLNTAQQS